MKSISIPAACTGVFKERTSYWKLWNEQDLHALVGGLLKPQPFACSVLIFIFSEISDDMAGLIYGYRNHSYIPTSLQRIWLSLRRLSPLALFGIPRLSPVSGDWWGKDINSAKSWLEAQHHATRDWPYPIKHIHMRNGHLEAELSF